MTKHDMFDITSKLPINHTIRIVNLLFIPCAFQPFVKYLKTCNETDSEIACIHSTSVSTVGLYKRRYKGADSIHVYTHNQEIYNRNRMST